MVRNTLALAFLLLAGSAAAQTVPVLAPQTLTTTGSAHLTFAIPGSSETLAWGVSGVGGIATTCTFQLQAASAAFSPVGSAVTSVVSGVGSGNLILNNPSTQYAIVTWTLAGTWPAVGLSSLTLTSVPMAPGQSWTFPTYTNTDGGSFTLGGQPIAVSVVDGGNLFAQVQGTPAGVPLSVQGSADGGLPLNVSSVGDAGSNQDPLYSQTPDRNGPNGYGWVYDLVWDGGTDTGPIPVSPCTYAVIRTKNTGSAAMINYYVGEYDSDGGQLQIVKQTNSTFTNPWSRLEWGPGATETPSTWTASGNETAPGAQPGLLPASIYVGTPNCTACRMHVEVRCR